MQRRAGGRLPAGCAKPGPRTSVHRTRSPAQRGDAQERGAAGGKTVTGKSVDGIFVAHRKTRRMCSGLAECSVNFAAMDDTFISPPPPDVVPDYVWRMKPGTNLPVTGSLPTPAKARRRPFRPRSGAQGDGRVSGSAGKPTAAHSSSSTPPETHRNGLSFHPSGKAKKQTILPYINKNKYICDKIWRNE